LSAVLEKLRRSAKSQNILNVSMCIISPLDEPY
jgi:hypothetical protein